MPAQRVASQNPQIEQCAGCGGRLKVIASIEEPELIERILTRRWERGNEGTRKR